MTGLAMILMIAGGISFILGLLLFMAIFVNPLREAFLIYFSRKPEYLLYKTGKGKEFKEGSGKLLKGLAIFLMLLGAGLFAAGYFMAYSPRGYAPLSAKESEGLEAGQPAREDESPLDENDKNTLIISGRIIRFEDRAYSRLEDFEQTLKEADRMRRFTLVDDFAVAHTYRGVVELLDRYGFDYEEGGT